MTMQKIFESWRKTSNIIKEGNFEDEYIMGVVEDIRKMAQEVRSMIENMGGWVDNIEADEYKPSDYGEKGSNQIISLTFDTVTSGNLEHKANLAIVEYFVSRGFQGTTPTATWGAMKDFTEETILDAIKKINDEYQIEVAYYGEQEEYAFSIELWQSQDESDPNEL